MVETLLARTSLPNLHPLVVHFPIALLVTALFFDLSALISRKRRWLDHGATLLYCLAGIGGAAAWFSGLRAADAMWSMPGAAQAALSEHQDLGLYTMAATVGLAAFRLFVAWLARKDTRTPVGLFRLVALFAAFAVVALAGLTADHGGALVYKHGMGVEATAKTP
ncbi:MAG: DUF2231 domain-containing protein [Acidobacteriota bacterium]